MSKIHFQKAGGISAMRTQSDKYEISWHAIITEAIQIMPDKCIVITEWERRICGHGEREVPY